MSKVGPVSANQVGVARKHVVLHVFKDSARGVADEV